MIEQELPVGESAAVKISIRSGRVVVETGSPGRARFSVDTRDPSFEIQQRGETIVASGERGSAFVTVWVSPMTNVEVSTASADITVAPPVGRLEIATASGDIVFDTASRLQVKTASGDLQGNGVDGEARCVTVSGDIRISHVGERANLSTASGEIVVDRCEGALTCSTVSGGIRVREQTGASLNAKSMSGSVRVGLLPRTRLDLDANSLSGRIKLPPPSLDSEPPEREIEVKVRTVSGDLRIDRID